MRMVHGFAAAALITQMTSPVSLSYTDREPAPKRKGRWPAADFIPNDHGPVIDSTPESKRARRRRLAKGAGE